MKKIAQLPKGIYVVAVSGGVDSVSLLDMLTKQKELKLVVAHFDHGIRETSHKDAEFVKGLAQKYKLPLEIGFGQLGEVGEEKAREARYAFLHSVKKKYQAVAIVTAHHSDDIIETIIINMLRGTGWKGLSSLRSGEIVRPLLALNKQDIVSYAKDHNLKWHEDETNKDEKYLRNKVRHNILSQMTSEKKQQFLKLYEDQLKLHEDIQSHVQDMATDRRHSYIMWPEVVAMEVLRSQFELTRPQAKRALHAIKTAKAGTEYELSKNKSLAFTDKNVTLVLK